MLKQLRSKVIKSIKFVIPCLLFLMISLTTAFSEIEGPIKIMPLGDSITLTYETSWRYELWKLLDADGFDLTYVGSVYDWFDVGDGFPRNHEGHGGWKIDGIIDEFDNLVTYDFDVVLVHLGTNDVWGGDSPDTALNDLADLVDVIRTKNPNAVIVLAQIIPADIGMPTFDEFSQRIPEVAALKTTAESPVYTADLYSTFDINTGLSTDGVHPSTEGFIMMGEAFYNDIASILAEIKEPDPDNNNDDDDPSPLEVSWQGSSWESGFAGSVTITNNTDQTVNSWELQMSFSNGEEISYCWNTDFSQEGDLLIFKNLGWNGVINPGGSVSFGFQGTHNGMFSFPDNAVVITD